MKYSMQKHTEQANQWSGQSRKIS